MRDKTKENLGLALAKLRASAGLSLEELAVKAEVSYFTVYKTEKGKSSPSALVLKRLATALGVQPSDIWKMVEKQETKKAV